MKLELKDMKISKVEIRKNEKGDHNTSISDIVYGFKNDVNILNPTSFTLIIKRNLSAGWYKEIPELDISGRLKSIEVNLNLRSYILTLLNSTVLFFFTKN